jgi:hypothetical protein
MAKSQWSVESFLAQVSNSGLAKPNRFEVSIAVPSSLSNASLGQKVSMYCDQAVLPYTRILVSQQRIFGPPSFHPVGVEYNGEGISLQFYVDREMNVKRFFDRWADTIVDRTTHTTNYQQNYLTPITISQLDESDTIVYQVQLIDAFPVSIGALQLDHSGQNQVHRLNVNFNFRRWIEKAVDRSASGIIATKSAGPDANNRGIFITQPNNIAPNFRNYGQQTNPNDGKFSNVRDPYNLVN